MRPYHSKSVLLAIITFPVCISFTLQNAVRPRRGTVSKFATLLSIPTAAVQIRNATSPASSKVGNATPEHFYSSVHLLSLQYLDDKDTNNHRLLSKRLKEVWKWKDAVLGDGRISFLPNPKTLKQFQSVFVKRSNKGSSRSRRATPAISDFVVNIEECAIVSNCARLEILLVVSMTCMNGILNDTQRTRALDSILKVAVSNTLLDQVSFYQSISFQDILKQQIKTLDLQTVLDGNVNNGKSSAPSTIHDLRNYWTHVQGTEEVCCHLCLVAAGMATRPNRPSQPVEFRPFSSRDSHILLQLKRTLSVSTGTTCQKILQCALTAGKACRNADKVPEISALKPGLGGHDKAEEQRVMTAALEKAIGPTVQECINSFIAAKQSKRIRDLRDTVMGWSTSEEETRWLRKQLHQPTMEIRKQDSQGGVEDSSRSDNVLLSSPDATILRQLQKELHFWRETVASVTVTSL